MKIRKKDYSNMELVSQFDLYYSRCCDSYFEFYSEDGEFNHYICPICGKSGLIEDVEIIE